MLMICIDTVNQMSIFLVIALIYSELNNEIVLLSDNFTQR